MDLSIITINFNTEKLFEKFLLSINQQTKNIKYEIIIVDNGSKKSSVTALKKLKDKYDFKLIESKINKGFSYGNNLGAAKAKGRYLLFLNSDTILKYNIFKDLILWMDRRPKAGLAGCTLVGLDGKLQETAGYFPTLLRVFSWMTIQDMPFVDRVIKPFHPLKGKSFTKAEKFFQRAQKVDWLMGAFMIVRRKTFKQIGGWDEDFFMYTEDTDICYRAKQAGWEVWYLPWWQVTHIGGASSTKEFPILQEYRGVKLFYKKHYPSWQMLILRILLKIGALGRIILFGILEGPESAKIYGKAFKQA